MVGRGGHAIAGQGPEIGEVVLAVVVEMLVGIAATWRIGAAQHRGRRQALGRHLAGLRGALTHQSERFAAIR